METKKLQSFKDLNVWQKSSDLAALIYKITERFPRSELYGLTNQMRRAVISIGSNIAEGFKRNHKKEKLQFYNIAYGSAAELESQIEISCKLNFLDNQDYKNLIAVVTEIGKMLDGLIKSQNRKFPKSYILNPIFFLIFLYSISYILTPSPTKAAVLYLMPQSQTIYQGDTFIVEVRINTDEEEINAVQIHLMFPPYLLEPVDIIKGNSILTLWAEEPKIQQGKISFVGGIPQGFKGEGSLIKISFSGKEIGKEDIAFGEDSKVLLNDGKGTPAKLSFREGSYEITEKPKELPVISSGTHPDQNKWYKFTTLHLHWDLIEGAEYSYLLGRDPISEPDETPDRPKGELIWMGDMEYDLEKEGDGIYYFSLRQKLSGRDWSKDISRFRVIIDTAPPEEFEPQIGQDPTVFGGKYFLSFAAQDKTSGVDRYEVAETPRILSRFIKNEKWKTAESPYLLEDQQLRSKISVKAIDKAGNEIIAEMVPSYKINWKDIVISLLILTGIGVIWWIIKKKVESRK